VTRIENKKSLKNIIPTSLFKPFLMKKNVHLDDTIKKYVN